jgi:hypothetical protein
MRQHTHAACTVFALQLQNWFRVLPPKEHPILILSNEELRTDPTKTMGKVCSGLFRIVQDCSGLFRIVQDWLCGSR